MKPSSNSQPSLTVVLGGARSGKSCFAVDVAKRCGRRIIYLATCGPGDWEMRQRIARHRRERPASWRTIEHPADPASTLARADGHASGVVIDDLTLYVSELLLQRHPVSVILKRVTQLCQTARRIRPPVILVSNDVGLGVVPPHRSGRQFRDAAGLANQIAARFADDVYFLVAGIPLHLKGSRGAHRASPGLHFVVPRLRSGRPLDTWRATSRARAPRPWPGPESRGRTIRGRAGR